MRSEFMLDFTEDIGIDLVVEGSVEGIMSASYRLSRERHRQLSYLIASIAGSLHLLI